MSSLISVVTPYCAVHVSDMQVTAFADGAVMSDHQRKSIAVTGDTVRCLVGWTGLAMIERHRTGDWLHGQLNALGAGAYPLRDLIAGLTESATLHFATLRAKDKRCAFSLCGWVLTSANTTAPFSCEISNYEVYPWKLSKGYSPKFQYAIATQKRPSKHPYMISVSGDEETARELPMHLRGLRGLLKRRAGIEVISGTCRQIVAAVAARQSAKRANDPRYIKTVGDSQLTVELDPAGGVKTYSSENGVITRSFPADVISPGLATKDMTVDRSVDDEGKIHLHIKGWVKTTRPGVLTFPDSGTPGTVVVPESSPPSVL